MCLLFGATIVSCSLGGCAPVVLLLCAGWRTTNDAMQTHSDGCCVCCVEQKMKPRAVRVCCQQLCDGPLVWMLCCDGCRNVIQLKRPCLVETTSAYFENV